MQSTGDYWKLSSTSSPFAMLAATGAMVVSGELRDAPADGGGLGGGQDVVVELVGGPGTSRGVGWGLAGAGSWGRHLVAGEAAGLRWSDLDLDAGTLIVTGQLQQPGGRLVAGPPKSDAGQRVIALDATTIAALRCVSIVRARQRKSSWEVPGACMLFLAQIGCCTVNPVLASGREDIDVDRVFGVDELVRDVRRDDHDVTGFHRVLPAL
jgi:hypothetical protein